MGERPTPDATHPDKRRPPPPPGTLLPPGSAQSQLRRAHVVELVTGLHARTPGTHDKWVVGPGSRPGWSGVGERPTPDTHTEATDAPPGAPLCRPHSAQSQLARARAVGLVTGPHAGTPRTHRQWVAGPGCTPQRRAVGRERAHNPGRPTPRREAPPPPGGGGAYVEGARGTHKQGTRGADPKVNQTEPAERTDHIEWRTGRRREGTPGQDNAQHAPRGTRGQGGDQGWKQEPAPAPTPGHTRPGHCSPPKQ